MTDEKGFTIHEDDEKTVFEITDPTAYQAYTIGVNDEKQWSRHPVTNALKNFVNTNRRHSQFFVKYGDAYTKHR